MTLRNFFFCFPTLLTFSFSPPWSVCLCALCPLCVVVDPPPVHRAAHFSFAVSSAVSLPSFRLLAFRLVFLWRPYVCPSARHIIGLIAPANSDLVLGNRPTPRSAYLFRFSFLTFLLPFYFHSFEIFLKPSSFLFFFPLFFPEST